MAKRSKSAARARSVRSAPRPRVTRSALPVGNAAVGQSGGPTAVINQSLVGVIEELRTFKAVKKTFGMRHGVSGLTHDPAELIDCKRLSAAELERVATTPSAILGSSRDKPDAAYCEKIFAACRANNIRYFFYIGGNDSSDTCRIVSELAQARGYDMRCFHVPKTVDNDLMLSDHTPGFPSAARFNALAFMSDSMDNASLPGVKINVVMGRHAGFLTAAAALARGEGGFKDRNGPHLIYLPEVPFDSDRFAADVQAVYDRLGRCQIAVSEGIQDAQGRPIITTLMERLDKDAHGNVQLSGVGALGDALADVVKKRVKSKSGKPVRVRADTFGYLQRCWPDPSPVDSKEARLAGREAVKLAKRGEVSGSIAIQRASSKPYKAKLVKIELRDVAAKTRHMPTEFFKGSNDVSDKFIAWCKPLVGPLPRMVRVDELI
ncbi:MAG: 6-phosphofructokinase [Phycisphaeraceae bacterium]|nr:6-phosphofructokinase [Phycisphaeraceae bacterium]